MNLWYSLERRSASRSCNYNALIFFFFLLSPAKSKSIKHYHPNTEVQLGASRPAVRHRGQQTDAQRNDSYALMSLYPDIHVREAHTGE